MLFWDELRSVLVQEPEATLAPLVPHAASSSPDDSARAPSPVPRSNERRDSPRPAPSSWAISCLCIRWSKASPLPESRCYAIGALLMLWSGWPGVVTDPYRRGRFRYGSCHEGGC